MTLTNPVITPSINALDTLEIKVKEIAQAKADYPVRIFRLFFKHRGRAPLEKVFKFKGTLRDAIERGQKHCISMGYVFIIVKPYEVDLDEQEELKKSDPRWFDPTVESGPTYV